MYASTLTLTDDFKKKTSKKMSTIRKGELRWEKLEQADRDGRLQQCSRRAEVGNLVGINDFKRAYTWTAIMVGKGAITETIRGFENGKAVYEYHLGVKPGYIQNGGTRKAVKAAYQPVMKPVEKPEMKVETQMNLTAPNDVTITIGEITIKVSGASIEYIAKLVKKLGE